MSTYRNDRYNLNSRGCRVSEEISDAVRSILEREIFDGANLDELIGIATTAIQDVGQTEAFYAAEYRDDFTLGEDPYTFNFDNSYLDDASCYDEALTVFYGLGNLSIMYEGGCDMWNDVYCYSDYAEPDGRFEMDDSASDYFDDQTECEDEGFGYDRDSENDDSYEYYDGGYSPTVEVSILKADPIELQKFVDDMNDEDVLEVEDSIFVSSRWSSHW